MFCAKSVAVAVETKKVEEMVQKALARANKVKRFFDCIVPEVDAYIEKELISGKGQFSQMISTTGGKYEFIMPSEGFVNFVKPSEEYRNRLPYGKNYWEVEKVLKWDIPLQEYVDYLRSLCFEVEIVDASWRGWSSTGKSSEMMHCQKLIVRIPKDLPCE